MARETAAGPSPSFTELHLAKAIEVIGEKPIGRAGLSANLQLGEGATRTLIDRLQTEQLITVSKAGCKLTKSGLSILKDLNSKFPKRMKIPASSITVGPYNFGILVNNAASKVRKGIEQRDSAVRAGASGAVTLIFRRGKLFMPPSAQIESKEWLEIAKQLFELFQPKENDVIIVGGADTEEKAEQGARAASWTLTE
jgi:hypothetical protein